MIYKKRHELIIAFFLLLLGLVAVFSSTFAWLNVSRVPFISDLEISVITDNDLVIAPDVDGQPGEWEHYLDASEFLKDMAPLWPVTCKNGEFYKITYDQTGRTDGVIPITEENITYAMKNHADENLSSVSFNAEDRSIGHMIALEFWLKCDGGNADVFLSDPVKTFDGQMGGGTYVVGTPVWSDETVKHENGGYGSETTIRLGFEIQHASTDAKLLGAKEFFLYEPNADIHIDSNNQGYVETLDVEGNNVIGDAHHIIQNASRWNEVSPALADTVVYQPGKFIQNRTLLSIKPSELVKVTLYYWVEGQDVDCLARSYADAVSITSNIQFGVRDNGAGRDIHVVRK